MAKGFQVGKSLQTGRELVILRADNRCEKCGVNLTRNIPTKPDRLTDRSIHHRQPQRLGGKDSVWCMVALCLGCHRGIHADEESAAKEGWITDRFPGKVPFLGWRGWVVPTREGGLDLVDFEKGRVLALVPPPPTPRRKQRGHRPRRTARQMPRIA